LGRKRCDADVLGEIGHGCSDRGCAKVIAEYFGAADANRTALQRP